VKHWERGWSAAAFKWLKYNPSFEFVGEVILKSTSGKSRLKFMKINMLFITYKTTGTVV
jgi:hypothetical protein